jgi:hypothetical protein
MTTGMFNTRMAQKDGLILLRYIQDENFGNYGESTALIDTVNVSISSNTMYFLGIHGKTC